MEYTSNLIRKAVRANQQLFFDGLRGIMQIPSVKGVATATAPFGEEPKRALEVTLKLAQSLGFTVGIVDNAVGYVQYGDNDEEYVGVLGHLDVVAAGTGWTYPPFDLTEDAGRLYGRGILDNKGPILSTLYALYTLKELRIPLDKTIRIILGTDEESGMSDIPLYLAKEQPPIYGFTPDCKFPAVYGERGMVTFEIKTTITDKSLAQLTSVVGDFTRSSVPDALVVTLQSGENITVDGKRAPSNAPELGENVITKLAQSLVDGEKVTGELLTYCKWLKTALHDKHDGAGLGIDFVDADSGKLQLTPYDIQIEADTLTLSVSMRYPISVTEAQIIEVLIQHIPVNTELTVIRRFASKLFPKDHPMVATMQQVYEEVTGMDGTPVTTTGATYARTMPNTIAFGPSFPGQKGIAHNKDEYMDVEDLMKNMEIYALLLAALAK